MTPNENRRHPDNGDGTFRNPIMAGDRPDPAVLRVGDDFYMTHSSADSVPGLTIWHSRDLVNWTYLADALPNPPSTVFAPDFVHHDGRFYLYIPTIPSSWSDRVARPEIFVIHAEHAAGPWSEPASTGIFDVIDPGHAVDDDGVRYLFTSGIKRVRLDADGVRADGPLEQVYDGWEYPDEWITEAYSLEGPKHFSRDGWHYLVSAVGGTSGPLTGHMVIVARSRSLDGPWENHPNNPIARTESAEEAWWSRGHATILDAADGSWWMVSHGYERDCRSLGRQCLLEPIQWTDHGWPVAPAADLAAALPKLPGECAPLQPLSDDFAEPAWGRRWSFEDATPNERSRASFGPDGLVLKTSGATPSDSSPLASRSTDRAYEIEVEVEPTPGAVGALLLYFNSRLYLGMSWDGQKMISYAGGTATHWPEPVSPGPVLKLKLVNDEHIITGYYAHPGEEWTRHYVRYDAAGYNATTVHDLKSLRPGLVAFGQGEVTFRNFRYRGIA